MTWLYFVFVQSVFVFVGQALTMAASRALASAASPNAPPTDAQILTRMRRILIQEMAAVSHYSRVHNVKASVTKESVMRRLEADLCISLDHRQQWITDEMMKCASHAAAAHAAAPATPGVRMPVIAGGTPQQMQQQEQQQRQQKQQQQRQQTQRRIAAAGPERMAAYWTRLVGRIQVEISVYP
jgi:hypothetical protein